ncbi:hypothetical protein LguiA_006414 [Lonicera macranthoides]
MEKSWSQKFRTYKNTLRSFLKNDNPMIVVPKGVDPIIWRKFVENEIQPTKKLHNKKNSENRKLLKSSHCLGHRTYAQKQYMMKQKNPEKQFRRVNKWLAARERPDGTVLESAKSKYDEVKAAQNRRKRTLTTEEEISTCEDLDNDELVEVFGKDNKGRVRGMGSNISKKQIVHVGVAAATYAEDLKAREEAISLKDEFINHMNSRLNRFEDFMNVVLSKLDMGKHDAPPTTITPNIDLGSCSMHCLSISQHVDNLFSTVGMSHPSSSSTPTNNPPVILCDKFSKELANGSIVTDATAGICHFKQVGKGERKVYVEEVFDPDANLWDPPQGGHDTFAGFVQGGFLIWLDCWLNYI